MPPFGVLNCNRCRASVEHLVSTNLSIGAVSRWNRLLYVGRNRLYGVAKGLYSYSTCAARRRQVVTAVTALARRRPEVNQRSGVSLRVSISNYETLLGNAFKRGLRCNEPASPRISDLLSIHASTAGKIELETVEEAREAKVVDDLIKRAVLNVFGRNFAVEEFRDLLDMFEEQLVVEVGSEFSSASYVDQLGETLGRSELVMRLGPADDPASFASAVELILEGLHLSRMLNRESVEGRQVPGR